MTERRLIGFAQKRLSGFLAALLGSMAALPAMAAGSNMPWEAPLQSILDSIQGPVARIVAVIIIVVTGLTLAFGDTSGGSTDGNELIARAGDARVEFSGRGGALGDYAGNRDRRSGDGFEGDSGRGG